MENKKARPMVDKDLREYVLSKFSHEFSFNASLRMLLGNHELSSGRFLELLGDNNALKQEIAKLHNEKVKLEGWSSDVSHHNSLLMDEIVGDRWRSIERARLSLYRGAAIGLITGLAIGHLFL